jgi:antitoxin component YwqK of YwqJK toxin-antitoxin module
MSSSGSTSKPPLSPTRYNKTGLAAEYIIDHNTHERLQVIRRENGRGEKMIYTLNEAGKIHGDYKVFTPDGKTLIDHAHYSNGIFHGAILGWHYNGKQHFSGQFKHGKAEGAHERWNDKGILQQKYFYSHGVLDGECKSWHPEGSLQEEATYIEGRRVGWHRFWPQPNKLGFEYFYSEGEVEGSKPSSHRIRGPPSL